MSMAKGVKDAMPGSVATSDTRTRAGVTFAVVAATLGIAAAAWVVVVRQMDAMDMGVATNLGPFPSFIALWTLMMAAMMLPGAVPAVLRFAHDGRAVRAVPLFIGSYLGLWTLVGIVVYAVYRPHGTFVAGVVAIVAGLYELTPLKRYFRQRCQKTVRSGLEFGLDCIGSSIGLMLMLVALGAMSVMWMAVMAIVIVTQKAIQPKAVIDVPLALAAIGLGILIVVAPVAIPGLAPAM